jgi:hypothetical protein
MQGTHAVTDRGLSRIPPRRLGTRRCGLAISTQKETS